MMPAKGIAPATFTDSPESKKRSLRLYNAIAIVILTGLFLAGAGISYKFYDAWLHNPDRIAREFHKIFYNSFEQTWRNNRWLGVQVEKSPFDIWVLQEVIYETKPDLIIEAGTWKGGSALFMATYLDLLQHGKVITVDIEHPPNLPQHPRITYLLGSSTAPEIVAQIKSAIGPHDKVLVVLDSDHHRDHVLNELKIYSQLVTTGSYLIVEDTNVNGHPVLAEFGPGPMEALQEFLKTNSSFEIDKSREKFLMTFNPNGYLRKLKD